MKFQRIKIFSLLGFVIVLISSCTINYLDYIQHVESPDGQYNYCLYSDFSIGDPGFMILKIEKEINPKKLKMDYSIRSGISADDANWIYSREILANYDEASYFCANPKIELIDNRFIVFSRGGYKFGLYDIKFEKDTFNNCCPFNDWSSQNIWAEKGTKFSGEIKKN